MNDIKKREKYIFLQDGDTIEEGDEMLVTVTELSGTFVRKEWDTVPESAYGKKETHNRILRRRIDPIKVEI